MNKAKSCDGKTNGYPTWNSNFKFVLFTVMSKVSAVVHINTAAGSGAHDKTHEGKI